MSKSVGNYVLILANGMPVGGCLSGIFEMDQAKALLKQGQKVIFLALDLRSIRHKRPWGIRKIMLEGLICYHASFPLGRVSLELFKAFGLFMLKNAYKKIVYENGVPRLIHAHFTDMGYFAGILKNTIPVKVVLTEHNSAINTSNVSKKNKKMAEIAYSSANAIISVSNALKVNMLRIVNTDIKVIPNIVDLSNFVQKVSSISHNGYRFISVGNLLKNKNHGILIRAFALAFGDSEDVTLDIIGDGEERFGLLALIKELHVDGKVRLLGRKNRQEIAQYFYNSDAFVLLSKAETFGVSFIEAMACGLPVISSRSGGPEDFINDDNGILVPVDDIDSAVRALIDIRNKKYNKEKIKDYVVYNFSENVIADKLCKIYNSLEV